MTTRKFKTISELHITKHNWQQYRAAVAAIEKALRDTDAELRALQRRQDLFPQEREQRQREARERGKAAVAQARAQLDQVLAKDRQYQHYVETPDAETVARRTYYAQEAAAELAGLDGHAVLSKVQALVEAGDTERAAEYVRAARVPAERAGLSGQWSALQRACTPKTVLMHEGFRAALDTVEANLSWLDQHIEAVSHGLGVISPEVQAGLVPEEGVDTRRLSLWVDRVTGEAYRAFVGPGQGQDEGGGAAAAGSSGSDAGASGSLGGDAA